MWREWRVCRRSPAGQQVEGHASRLQEPQALQHRPCQHRPLQTAGPELQHAHDRQGQVERPGGGRWLATPAGGSSGWEQRGPSPRGGSKGRGHSRSWNRATANLPLLRRSPETGPHPRLLWTPQRPPCLGCNRAGCNQAVGHTQGPEDTQRCSPSWRGGRSPKEGRGGKRGEPGGHRALARVVFVYMWPCGVFIAARASSSSRRGCCSLNAVRRLLTAGASLVAEHRL